MIFIAYAHTSDSSIKSSMGAADYSYYFVLKRYIPVLKALGTLIQIAEPERELDEIVSAAKLARLPCVFLQFSPPHKIYPHFACPSISVFAWEYTSVPTDSWGGDEWNDWRKGLHLSGAAITHSKMAVSAVKTAMGESYPIVDVAAPLWNTFEAVKTGHGDALVNLKYDGCFFDSWQANFNVAEKQVEECEGFISRDGPQDVALEGIVYTSVFCPIDGRKNWGDLVSAFCYAFRDKAEATLVLKTIHFDDLEGLRETLPILCKNTPFKCRIVIIAGFLSSETYQDLIRASSYIVNSSYGEGQCLPLMEFMSAGVPAIAPAHSAMADYVSAKSGFPLESSPEWTHWPHDPRILLKTMRFRLNWESLRQAYVDSFELRREGGAAYSALQQGAKSSLYDYCSEQEAQKKLREFFSNTFRLKDSDLALRPIARSRQVVFYLALMLVRLSSPDRWRPIIRRNKEKVRRALSIAKAKLG